MKMLNEFIEYLGLEKPVSVTVKTGFNEYCDAYYQPRYSDKTGKLKAHKIVIFVQDAHRDFDTLLAHELIHAAQEEKNKAEVHGKYFQRVAKKMQKEFSLEDIYVDELDGE